MSADSFDLDGDGDTTDDPFAYMSFNPDVATAYRNNPTLATEHYIEHGYSEGRRVT